MSEVDPPKLKVRPRPKTGAERARSWQCAAGSRPDVNGEEFRNSMLRYASDLEEWRWNSLIRLARLVQPAMVGHATASLY